jgi:AhpD family alkylhydroperoxidase
MLILKTYSCGLLSYKYSANTLKRSGKLRSFDKKFKELIALGISIAIKCEACILRHLSEDLKMGANIDEIIEVIKMAALMGGGPSLAYGVKDYKVAKELSRV